MELIRILRNFLDPDGKLNGITLLFPEIVVRIVFAAIGIVHGVVIWKYLLLEYTKAFQEE